MQVKEITHTNSVGIKFQITIKSTGDSTPNVYNLYDYTVRNIDTHRNYRGSVCTKDIERAIDKLKQACERIRYKSNKKLTTNSLNKNGINNTK